MKTLHFSQHIQAPRALVWQRMLDDASYRQWTTPFCEGSYYEGSWQQGQPMRFLSPGGDGMVAVIAENRLHELLSIKHLGVIHKGVEDTSSDEVKRWAPAYETYSFRDADADATELTVTMDCTEDYEDYMAKAWPKALATLKAICER